jgi:RNA polymerase sigma-70 factor (ECF subfamily)
MARQCHSRLRTLLETLPQRQKAALALYYFGELTAPRAAQILEMSVSAFEALLVRGKRALKAALIRERIRGTGDLL